MKEPRFDIHQHVTNQIVAAIEAGYQSGLWGTYKQWSECRRAGEEGREGVLHRVL
jgi:hypothetical protein